MYSNEPSKFKPKTDIAKLQMRLKALTQERSSWLTQYRDISEVILPRSGYFLLNGRDTQRGRRRDNNIINNTPTRAMRILGAGMHSGLSNPAKPWFKHEASPRSKMKSSKVRKWLSAADKQMRDIFASSNIYRTLPQMYTELGAYGTAAAIVDTNLRGLDGKFTTSLSRVFHTTFCTVGSYCLAKGADGSIDTFYRELDMSIAQLVERFGITNVSTTVRNLANRGENLDHLVRIAHVIEPRIARDFDSPFASDMAFRSSYFEVACREDQVLSESGYRKFNVLVPRWDVEGDDVYGSGPGMDVLGDSRSLQNTELRKAQVVDFQAQPPIVAPTSMKSGETDFLPGGVSYYDGSGPNSGVRTAFEVNLKLADLDNEIVRVESRIERGLYADLFRMLANDTRSNVTAREIAERHEEKLLALGPVIERVNHDGLRRACDIGFDAMVEHDEERVAAGFEPLLDAPPEELEGEELNVEFVSMLTQAMKAAGAGAVDRFIGTVTAVAQVKPEVLDKIDGDALVDEYAEMLGVSPDVLVNDDVLLGIREGRAKAQKAQAEAAIAEQATKSELNSAQASAATASATQVSPAVATANAIPI